MERWYWEGLVEYITRLVQGVERLKANQRRQPTENETVCKKAQLEAHRKEGA